MNTLKDFADLLDSGVATPVLADSFTKGKGTCHDCGGNTSRHGGNMVCMDCGQVTDSVLDVNDEYRNAASIKDTERCVEARPTLGNEAPVLTAIGFAGMGLHGKVQKTAAWSMASSRQRMFQNIYNQSMDLCKSIDLPEIVAKTMSDLYYDTYVAMESRSHQVKRNNVTKCLLAGCFFFACIEHQCPRDLKEIAEIINIQHKMVSTGRNMVIEVLGGRYAKIPPLKASHFLPRFVNTLNISWDVRSRILALAKLVEEQHILHECSPMSMSAGLIWAVVSGLQTPSVQAISDCCRVSRSVMQRVAKQLQKDPRLHSFWSSVISDRDQ